LLYQNQQGRCALTGRAMTAVPNDPNKMSLDRIDNNGAYEVGNIQLTTAVANFAKQGLSVPDLVRLATDVIWTNSLPLVEWFKSL
jgi:hypothetical protein